MADDKEIITGSDFRRMIAGAYSAFLLEYENINKLDGTSLADRTPGTNMLRTMGAAAMAIRNIKNEGIGAVACSVSSCAVLGARGNSGVLLAQIFHGIAKGLAGKYDVTSSTFGKAFQFGILYAHRTSLEKAERSIIITAKAAAKGAYRAVRGARPISEILTQAINAAKAMPCRTKDGNNHIDAGAKALLVLLEGCRSGLDGNFVSPALPFSPGTKTTQIPLPSNDIVKPYCVRLIVHNCKASVDDIKKVLTKEGSMLVIKRKAHDAIIHLHMEKPGSLIEQITGWGSTYDMHVDNMAQPHEPVILGHPLQKISVLAVASDKKAETALQQQGAFVIAADTANHGLTVGNLVNTIHSDAAEKYILLPDDINMNLMAYQITKLIGKRVTVIYTNNLEEQIVVLKAHDKNASPEENVAKMNEALKHFRDKRI